MENQIQTALQNLNSNQATSKEVDLLHQSLSNGQIFIGGNVQNSVIISGDGNTVQLTTEAINFLTTINDRSSLHQLPQPPADFIGREQELKKVLKNLDKMSGAAISGLIGMGGTGKTALGLVIAHSLIEKYPEAQFFLDMRGTSQEPLRPLDVMKHVIQSVNPIVNLKNVSEAELAGRYRSVLSEKKSILFLDNVHNASQVASLLPPANCLMLITSRMHFTIAGLRTVELGILKEKDAVRLLVEICPRLTKIEARSIAKLCGYLPIALRLAASYLSIHTAWTAQEYIASLSDKTSRLEILNLEGADINVSASFEQSYHQIPTDEQRRWNMLAIFPASFKQDALASIWDVNDISAHKLADKLCQYSLLSYDIATARYSLHDLLADYAMANLTPDDKLLAQLRHLNHYQVVWFNAEYLYSKGSENIANGLELFQSESRHFETAYEWASKTSSATMQITPLLAKTPSSLRLIHIKVHPNKRLEWFQAALSAAEKMEDLNSQNLLLGNIGTTFDDIAEFQKAIPYYEQAIEISKQLGDQEKEGFWLGNMGAAYSNLGKIPKGLDYLGQALEIARRFEIKHLEVDCLNNIAMSYSALGETHMVIDYLGKASEIAHEIGNREKEGVCLGNIGAGYINLGEHYKALEYLEQALKIARELGDKPHEDFWLGTMGIANMNLGRYEQAIEYYKQALEISHQDKNRRNEHYWMGNIATIYLELGEYHKALEYFEPALAITREIGDRQSEGEWLGNIGLTYALRGENQEAKERLEEALAIARAVDGKWQIAQWQNGLGELYINMNLHDMARQSLEEALKLSKELNIHVMEGASLFTLAKLLKEENNVEAALQYARDAQSIFESIEHPELKKVYEFIGILRT